MPKIVDHDKQKLNILNDFLKIFSENGYKKARLSQVTCVSRTTVYQYYDNKEDVFKNVVENLDRFDNDFYVGMFAVLYKDRLKKKYRKQINDKIKGMYISVSKLFKGGNK